MLNSKLLLSVFAGVLLLTSCSGSVTTTEEVAAVNGDGTPQVQQIQTSNPNYIDY